MNNGKTIRVAIYTRKSVEDSEEKQFNSIDAQRQMCESFIAAKAAEGWIALPERFDDYGYSGGNLERPAYQRLMAQCEQGLVDKIIVFRIDRMTRSTKDFCEFDEKMKKLGVGFTSVSEPFVDTSSPMGELVVNLLVSFGQWERKTIQERIQKHFKTALDQGFFVGGIPPYGYKVENQTLIPDPKTAQNVPHIFELFVQLHSAKKVAAKLAEEGIERFPGRAWTTQSVYNCLGNVRYVGDANSHGKIVKVKQQALITRELWDRVRNLVNAAKGSREKKEMTPEAAVYQGLIFCGHCQHPMSYRWSKKDTLGVRKYPYFICQQDARKGVSECPIRHVSATTVQEAIEQELESIMMASTTMLVAAANVTPFTPEQIVTGFRRHDFWQQLSTNDRKAIYRLFIRSVTVFESALDIRVKMPCDDARNELVKTLCIPATPTSEFDTRIDADGCLFMRIPVAFRTVSGRKKIVRTDGGSVSQRPTQHEINNTLLQGAVLKAIARAFAWLRLIDEGKASSVHELADLVEEDRHYVRYTLRLAFLSPRIIRAAMTSDLPNGFSLEKVRKVETDDWAEQERILGFPST